jgi:hypothetical protein
MCVCVLVGIASTCADLEQYISDDTGCIREPSTSQGLSKLLHAPLRVASRDNPPLAAAAPSTHAHDASPVAMAPEPSRRPEDEITTGGRDVEASQPDASTLELKQYLQRTLCNVAKGPSSRQLAKRLEPRPAQQFAGNEVVSSPPPNRLPWKSSLLYPGTQFTLL